MDNNLIIKPFAEIDLNDSFFDSLKQNYAGFEKWFYRKAREGHTAYTYYIDGKLKDFLYLKLENDPLNDVSPILPAKKRLKVGTFKIENRKTGRGDRFIKKIVDCAISYDVEEIYVTIFPTEELSKLIKLFQTYGFEYRANKVHEDGRIENVYIKQMHNEVGDMLKDYPHVCCKKNKYLLSIYPKYHTRLFPDSILHTEEKYDIVNDVSETNSIYKIYICWMKDVWQLTKGDIVVIYRTNDGYGPAKYRSVATSICTVFEVKTIKDFGSLKDFISYANRYSVFSEEDLSWWYNNKPNFTVLKLLYNVAFPRKVIRDDLIKSAGIQEEAYWGFMKITNNQFIKIISLSEANECYFINKA